jgi:peptidoglycan/LPS O-acetylase OafA/YrhL
VKVPEGASPATKDNRVDILDGLRGFAMWWVFWVHLHGVTNQAWAFTVFGRHYDFTFFPQMGFLGLQVFFFISGFVLFYPHARHVFEGKPLPSVKEFALRRFLKIVPSYIVAMAIVLLIFPPLGWPPALIAWHVISHLLFVHTWFPDTFASVNIVFWSLGVEVQFYVIFPLLCWLFRRYAILTYAGMTIVALGYRALVLACCLKLPSDLYRLFQMPAYLDLFAAGMLAAYLFVLIRSKIGTPGKLTPIFSGISLALLVAAVPALALGLKAFLAPGNFVHWTIVTPLYVSWMVFAFTIASLLSGRLLRSVIANRLLTFTATISFNMYLYHLTILSWMFFRHHPRAATADPRLDPHWQWMVTILGIVLSVGVATFFTFVLERPILALERRFAKRPAAAQGPKTSAEVAGR